MIRDNSFEDKRRVSSPGRTTALKKAEHYCTYQERSHHELRNKLYELGLYPNDVENVICAMIAKDLLNEERFAFAYVSGKFKINHWGKIKIKWGLKQKLIPDKMIVRALNTIDLDDYLKTLDRLVEKKLALTKVRNPYQRKSEVIQYLLHRGFEYNLIQETLKERGFK